LENTGKSMNVLQRIYEIHELPTLPEILFRIQSIVNSDEGNATSLAAIVGHDPSLTAKILKVSNSSYYGISNQRIVSLSAAIARIGFNEVRNIVTAISLIKQFPKRSNLLDYKKFWRHSLSAAFLMTQLRNKLHIGMPVDGQTFFLAGLLHDIGILVYDQFFHKEFAQIIEYAMQNELAYLGAEMTVVGKETHQMVGGVLLELWKMDSSVLSGVRFHNGQLDKVPEHHRVIAQMTNLTEFILCNCGFGTFEGTIYEIDQKLLDEYCITSTMIAELYAAAESLVEKSDLIIAMGMSAEVGQLRSI